MVAQTFVEITLRVDPPRRDAATRLAGSIGSRTARACRCSGTRGPGGPGCHSSRGTASSGSTSSTTAASARSTSSAPRCRTAPTSDDSGPDSREDALSSRTARLLTRGTCPHTVLRTRRGRGRGSRLCYWGERVSGRRTGSRDRDAAARVHGLSRFNFPGSASEDREQERGEEDLQRRPRPPWRRNRKTGFPKVPEASRNPLSGHDCEQRETGRHRGRTQHQSVSSLNSRRAVAIADPCR